MSKYLRVFNAVFRQGIIIRFRYPLNFISALITLYVIFFLLFKGSKMFYSGMTDKSLEGLIIGFFIWIFSIMGYSELSWGLASEARQGTLEQLYLSPVGFNFVVSSINITSFVFNLFFSLIFLFLMEITTGKYLHFSFIQILSFIPTISFAYAIGMIMAGLTILYKQVQSMLQIVQFLFVFLLSVSSDKYVFLKILPITMGKDIINKLNKNKIIPFSDYLFLWCGAIFFLFVSYLLFDYFIKRTREKGVMGHY